MTIIKTSQIRNNGSVTNNKRLGSSPFPPGLIDEYVQPSSQTWMVINRTGGLHAFKKYNR